ncbi:MULTISPECIES: DUF6221 family protein, partial [Streptomyces]|jgi:hypothetical protein
MTAVADLASFLNARWDEAERESELFHEPDCPTHLLNGHHGSCACLYPAQIRERTASHRRILHDCLQRISHEQASSCWPMESILAFQAMKALALPFELHPAFQDTWHTWP